MAEESKAVRGEGAGEEVCGARFLLSGVQEENMVAYHFCQRMQRVGEEQVGSKAEMVKSSTGWDRHLKGFPIMVHGVLDIQSRGMGRNGDGDGNDGGNGGNENSSIRL